MKTLVMKARTVVTHSPEETVALGYELARELTPPVLVLLLGDLGAGKTTLTKGIVAGLGAAPEEEVTSPTFTMIHEYGPAALDHPTAHAAGSDWPLAKRHQYGVSGRGSDSDGIGSGAAGRDTAARVYHVDLYRVETARELETLGLEDLIAEHAVVIVEWGERLGPALRPSGPGSVVEIHLEAPSESERRIEIR